jgi:hypothetical protein
MQPARAVPFNHCSIVPVPRRAFFFRTPSGAYTRQRFSSAPAYRCSARSAGVLYRDMHRAACGVVVRCFTKQKRALAANAKMIASLTATSKKRQPRDPATRNPDRWYRYRCSETLDRGPADPTACMLSASFIFGTRETPIQIPSAYRCPPIRL